MNLTSEERFTLQRVFESKSREQAKTIEILRMRVLSSLYNADIDLWGKLSKLSIDEFELLFDELTV